VQRLAGEDGSVRLLHVVPTYLPAWRHGGPAVSVHGLCKALAARGHEVTVLTTDVHGVSTLDVQLGKPVPIDGVAVWYFPVAPPRRLYRSPELGAALARELEERESFDLVHLHSVFLWPTAAAARAAERAGVPYLVAPRGMLVRDLLRRRGRLRKQLWIRLVERRTLARAAGLHATSEIEKEEIRLLGGELGLQLPDIHVVPNGVDAARWDAARGRRKLAPLVGAVLQRRPLLLFLGRLSWKKGLDRLVSALALLSEQLPEVTLALAGNDEEGCWARLNRQAGREGVADNLKYLGFVQGDDKAALLHGADLLVLPSYSENFGNVVLEAMAAGLPVVVTPEVGLAGVVREHEAGVVVPGDPPRLAAALCGLLADASGLQAMGRRGAEAAARRFGWGAVAARMEEVYSELLAARGSRTDVRLRAEAGSS
jgi:glycosyltransferase involved in cell wall biosynthesis